MILDVSRSTNRRRKRRVKSWRVKLIFSSFNNFSQEQKKQNQINFPFQTKVRLEKTLNLFSVRSMELIHLWGQVWQLIPWFYITEKVIDPNGSSFWSNDSLLNHDFRVYRENSLRKIEISMKISFMRRKPVSNDVSFLGLPKSMRFSFDKSSKWQINEENVHFPFCFYFHHFLRISVSRKSLRFVDSSIESGNPQWEERPRSE